jgi:hypothetical protein
MKALDSGDNAAAEGYLTEANNTLEEGPAKTEVGDVIKALHAGDINGTKMDIQAAQGGL